MASHTHWSRQYEHDLEALRSRVMAMGGLVESQLKQALEGLGQGRGDLLDEVIAGDDRVNALEVEIDDDCAHLIARRQPAARDLRMILGVSKIVTDLERIGDKARKVARLARGLAPDPILGALWRGDMRRVGAQAAALLSGTLDAFARWDAQGALAVIRDNRELGRANALIETTLIQRMVEQAASVPVALDMMAVLRAFDRVGDHSTNVCEQLVYILTGTDVRHATLDRIERAVGE